MVDKTKANVIWIPAPSNPSRLRAPGEEDSNQALDWDTKKIKVLRVPASSLLGSGPSYVELTLGTTMIHQACDHDEETASTEQSLKHIPNIQDVKDARFDWKNRYLVIANLKVKKYPELNGVWCMYTCTKPNAGLPLGAEASEDVWLFKRENGKSTIVLDELGRARYAESWQTPKGKNVRMIIRHMARCEKNLEGLQREVHIILD